jgi:hypothetical protein
LTGKAANLNPDYRRLLRINRNSAADNRLLPARIVTVVGVTRDVPGLRFTAIKEAGVFLPAVLDVEKTSMVARKASRTWRGKRCSAA